MQQRRRGHGAGPGVGGVHHVLGTAHAAAADDRHVHGLGHGADQLQIHAVLQALTVHAGQQNLAGAQLHAALGPLHHVQTRVLAAVVVIGLPLALLGAAFLGLNGQHHALAAKSLGHLGDDLGRFDGLGVDGRLVRAHLQNVAHILHTAQPAAHGDGDEHLVAGAAHNVREVVAVVQAGHNVNVQQLVNALLVILPRKAVGVAQLAQPLQLNALHQVHVLDVQPGDEADLFLFHGPFPAFSRP